MFPAKRPGRGPPAESLDTTSVVIALPGRPALSLRERCHCRRSPSAIASLGNYLFEFPRHLRPITSPEIF